MNLVIAYTVPEFTIADLACRLIEEKPLQRQKRLDHVFADRLCLAPGLRPDLAVDVETCVSPAEDLLDQGKADELFPQQQKKILDLKWS